MGEKLPDALWKWQDRNMFTGQTKELKVLAQLKSTELCLLSRGSLKAGMALPSPSWDFSVPILLGAQMLRVLGLSNLEVLEAPNNPLVCTALHE